MRYGSLVGLAATLFGLGGWSVQGPGRWLFVWACLSFALVALGYLGLGAWMLGKQPSGSRRPWGYPLGGPFLLFMKSLRFALTKLRWREDPWNEVAEGIFVGRLVPLEGLPPSIRTVVDLTSEHLEDPSILESKRYLCLPTLDGSAPRTSDLVALLQTRDQWQGDIYVHCAAGHGRSALVAACLIVLGGFADSIDEAMLLMKRRRPKVHLAPLQRRIAISAVEALQE